MREIDEYSESFYVEALAEYLTIFIFLSRQKCFVSSV